MSLIAPNELTEKEGVVSECETAYGVPLLQPPRDETPVKSYAGEKVGR